MVECSRKVGKARTDKIDNDNSANGKRGKHSELRQWWWGLG